MKLGDKVKKELKEKIDNAWLRSDYGEWCVAVANNDEKKANEIRERVFNSKYLFLSTLEDELAYKLAELFDSEAEVEEYLRMLDRENPELVGVLIRTELFYDVSDLLKK